MSDAAMRVDLTTKPKAPKDVPSPRMDFENPMFFMPKFEMPKFEMPTAIREFAEKGGAQVKQNYEKMKTASEEMAGAVEASFASAAKGATDYGLKVIEITNVNTKAGFDFVGKLMAVKSPSEVVELLTAHARQQVDAVSDQNKELLALAQKVATEAAEPIKTGMSKAFERVA